jgi:hypothetical protein
MVSMRKVAIRGLSVGLLIDLDLRGTLGYE